MLTISDKSQSEALAAQVNAYRGLQRNGESVAAKDMQKIQDKMVSLLSQVVPANNDAIDTFVERAKTNGSAGSESLSRMCEILNRLSEGVLNPKLNDPKATIYLLLEQLQFFYPGKDKLQARIPHTCFPEAILEIDKYFFRVGHPGFNLSNQTGTISVIIYPGDNRQPIGYYASNLKFDHKNRKLIVSEPSIIQETMAKRSKTMMPLEQIEWLVCNKQANDYNLYEARDPKAQAATVALKNDIGITQLLEYLEVFVNPQLPEGFTRTKYK